MVIRLSSVIQPAKTGPIYSEKRGFTALKILAVSCSDNNILFCLQSFHPVRKKDVVD